MAPEGSADFKMYRVSGIHLTAQDRVVRRLDIVRENVLKAIEADVTVADTKGLVVVPTYSDWGAPDRIIAEVHGVAIADYIAANGMRHATIYSMPARWIGGAA